MTQAIFYPTIEPPESGWLKTSILYWDTIRTIVPEGFDRPYTGRTAQALHDQGILVPLRVDTGMHEVESLADQVMAYLDTPEGREVLEGRDRSRHVPIPESVFIYEGKLPELIRRSLTSAGKKESANDGWLRVGQPFASFYMTLLASTLAERIGASLLTTAADASRLAISARLGQEGSVVPHSRRRRIRENWQEYEAYGNRHRTRREVAEGMLAHLAIERIGVDPKTPLDTLLDFREAHADELGQFRSKITALASAVERDLPIEAMRQQVSDIYNNEVAPALSNLKGALAGRRIRWLADGLLSVSCLSVSSTHILTQGGLDVPSALLALSGVSLAVSGVVYGVEKRAAIRANPYAYLMSMQKALR